MIKYITAFLLIASPCLAGMGVGGFPQPGPGVMAEGVIPACNGTEIFCTSWEDGSGVLNTGGAGVWSSTTGSLSKITSDHLDGLASVSGTGELIKTISAAPVIYARLAVKFTGENIDGDLPQGFLFLQNSGSTTRAYMAMLDDGSNYDSTVLLRTIGKTVDDNYTTVGTDFSVSLNTWYQIIVRYDTSANVLSSTLYNEAGTSALNTWTTTLTNNDTIDYIRTGFSGSGNVLIQDAASFSASLLSPIQ